MKAWLAREKDEFCATVVFAETRGKAKALALYANASPEDLANIACHLLSEAFIRTVIVNIDMVKDALDEYEDEEGETE